MATSGVMWASNEISPSEMAICRACGTPPSAGKVGKGAAAVGAGATIVGTEAEAVGTGGTRICGAKSAALETGVGAPMVAGEEDAEVEEKEDMASTSEPPVMLGEGAVGSWNGKSGSAAVGGATGVGFKRGADRLRRGAGGVGAERAVVEIVEGIPRADKKGGAVVSLSESESDVRGAKGAKLGGERVRFRESKLVSLE